MRAERKPLARPPRRPATGDWQLVTLELLPSDFLVTSARLPPHHASVELLPTPTRANDGDPRGDWGPHAPTLHQVLVALGCSPATSTHQICSSDSAQAGLESAQSRCRRCSIGAGGATHWPGMGSVDGGGVQGIHEDDVVVHSWFPSVPARSLFLYLHPGVPQVPASMLMEENWPPFFPIIDRDNANKIQANVQKLRQWVEDDTLLHRLQRFLSLEDSGH